MNKTTTASSASSQSRLLQLGLAALLGIVILGVTGFSSMAVAHNAAHDYRHSLAFPCH